MSNITSSAPTAYAALLGLITAAASAQDQPVSVFPFELEQYEPASYVLLTGIENHQFDIETLNYAFLEHYDIVGIATVLQGDVDPSGVLAATYALYQDVVQTVVVENRGGPAGVLGVTEADGGPLLIVPGYARYTGSPASFGGGTGGFQGTIEFSYHLQAYLNVTG